MYRYMILPIVFCAGCSHISELVDNPTIEHDTIRTNGEILSISGDRRVVRGHKTSNRVMICAETQADAISGRSQNSTIQAVGRGAISDSIDERLSLTYARTELSDVVRQLSFQLCNANLNGTLNDLSYQVAMLDLQDQAMRALLYRSSVDNAKSLQALTTKAETDIAKIKEELTKVSKEREEFRKILMTRVIEECKVINANDQEALKRCAF